MTYRQMLTIALEQSAIDSSCSAEDFLKGENTVVKSVKNERARRYLKLPFILDLTSYGSGIVASVGEGYEEIATDYINRFTEYHCFETPNLHVLSEALRPTGADVCFMAEYWLAKPERLGMAKCDYRTKILTPSDFSSLYTPEWSNALCSERRHLDRLCIGAYDGDRLIALCGASADCEDMWQIGIDVLPEYRHRGIASALTSSLALEIIALGRVPFYCCAWSNVASARNAISAGFVPAWVQVTARRVEEIRGMNGECVMRNA